MKQAITNIAIRTLPSSLLKTFMSGKLKEITEAIRAVSVSDSSSVQVGNRSIPAISLDGGPRIVGHWATTVQKKLVGQLALEKGLSKDFSKVLLDTVTRYQYSHMETPVATLRYPSQQRFMFHPQQKNLVQEDDTIDQGTRKRIKRVFTPCEGWKVLDIGAFLGHGSLKMRSQIGETGKIISVEASPDNFEILKESLACNGFQNIHPVNAAIWRVSGEKINFTLTKQQANAVDPSVVSGTNVASISTESIASLSDALDGPADLVSLTVNGAEVEAIEGLSQSPQSLLPKRVMAPGWYQKDGRPRSQLIVPMLQNLGYECVCTKGHFVVAWQQDCN